jgi:hypothetical protein
MKTPQVITVAVLTAATLPAAALLVAHSAAASGTTAVRAPGPGLGHRYCAYSSSTLSTSPSPPGGSCSTTSSTPSSA